MAIIASLIGPLLLLAGLAAADTVRRSMSRQHISSLPITASANHRATAQHEASVASSIAGLVTLTAVLAALTAAITPFTSGWALIIFGLGGIAVGVRSLPRMGLPELGAVNTLLTVARTVVFVGALVLALQIDGAIGAAIGLVAFVAVALMVRYEMQILGWFGLVAPIPEHWTEQFIRLGVDPENVRVRKRTTAKTNLALSGRLFMPSSTVERLTPHQAATLANLNLGAARHGLPPWLQVHVLGAVTLGLAAAGPSARWFGVTIGLLCVAIGLVSFPYTRSQIAELTRRLDDIAQDPDQAASMLAATEIFRELDRFPSSAALDGFSDEQIAQRLSRPAPGSPQNPQPWHVVAKMLPVSLLTAALPLLLAAPAAQTLGPRAEAVVAVGTNLGDNVDAARQEASILIYYSPALFDEDVQSYVAQAQQAILLNVEDPDLHREAVAIYLEQCTSTQQGNGFALSC